MKLTKEIISVLKYQGFMTSTSDTEIFLDNYDTVEELGDAGFIGDRGAIDFLRNIFDENGVNMVGETKEEDVVEPEPEKVEETTTEPEKVEETTTEPEKVEETTTEPEKVEETAVDEPKKVEETAVDEPKKVEETAVDEPEKVEETAADEPKKVEETEKPKKKGKK